MFSRHVHTVNIYLEHLYFLPFNKHEYLNAEQPYNYLPPLPPKHDIESKAVLKQCINARAALAELKQAAELIPNQSMLINTLPTMEARASSEIENIITTTDKLFQYMRNRKPSR